MVGGSCGRAVYAVTSGAVRVMLTGSHTTKLGRYKAQISRKQAREYSHVGFQGEKQISFE